ncbi:MAG: hypothetical protein IPK50_19950 [Fibrobacterota bacterium]|nr:hypothetical protein [Fibrobacterota bacterium]QQS04533.1 MAG: hypothetical protein IPK50_19950 [Fibrobacterota bacterium]
MSLQDLSTEDLVKEIARRKSAEVGEIRRQIDEHKKAIRDLEDKIRARDGEVAPVRRGRAASSSSLPAGERAERVLTALEGATLTITEVAAKVGFDGLSLKKTLDELVAERKIGRTGKARGTRYSLT